ncbi:MAG: YggS family pyridoxal phosphate-dependent enzyme [Candidatus Woesearchaeota archaeon]|nr:YggS family pyridoxal phosphate-dependent enzyme [Candidatus Woesearchaeota archaeon]
MSIRDNVGKILSELPPGVMLVAAAKTQTQKRVLEAIDAGVKIIGENYVQEAEKKFGKNGEKIRGKAELHLIGALQKGKINRALKIFDVIESVDSISLAEEISKKAKAGVKIFLEINISDEKSKSGFKKEAIPESVKRISALPRIKLIGLMTMPFSQDERILRRYFGEMKKIFDELKIKYPEMKFLSMGMSSDYKIAIEEGSNVVRIGTAIFGEREN